MTENHWLRGWRDTESIYEDELSGENKGCEMSVTYLHDVISGESVTHWGTLSTDNGNLGG